HLKSKMAAGIAQNDAYLIDKIISTIDHMSDTVERVVDFAHPIEPGRRPIDINRLVEDSIQVLEPQIATNNISVKLDLCMSGAVGMLDEASVRSALLNLIINAVQAMPAGGDLTINTGKHNGSLHIKIVDTGCGIAEERLVSIFEPFNTTKSRGLGLGLSYAKKVINEHHVTIAVTSQTGKAPCVEDVVRG